MDQVRTGKRRPLQRRKAGPNAITPAKRKRFLDTLAATCNVDMAAEAAGFSQSSAYRERRRTPGFADLWEEALGIGYRRLEEQLLQRALEGMERVVIDPEAAGAPPLPPLATLEAENAEPAPARGHRRPGAGAAGAARLPVAVQIAFQLLARRDGAERNGARPGGRRRMTGAEVNALLLKKLDALARSEDAQDGSAPPADDAAVEAGEA